MKRNISDFIEKEFDVIIIGGGIHGAATAWQCAAQGMAVALVEKNDFGSVTSANSLKIIHGGFRYLQHLNVKRMRESIVSRRIMALVSPHNVQPLRCVIPNSGLGLRSRFLMRIALYLNDIISFDRNKGVQEECKIPAGKIMSLAQCKDLFPRVDWSGKTGGAVWYDAIARNSERLTLSFVRQAVEMGACVANYLEMKDIITENSILQGCVVYDSIGKKTLRIKGKTIVITGGASNDRLLGMHQNRNDIQKNWAKAVNIVVKKELLNDTAIGLTGETDFVDNDAFIKKKGRFFFFVPWRGYTMIGTTYVFDSSLNEQVEANKPDVEEILSEVNTIFPEAKLSIEDVSKVHAGLVPAYSGVNNENSEVQLVKETELFDLGKKIINPVKGLFAVKSVKYTTAPIVAIEVAKEVLKFLGIKYQNTAIKPHKEKHLPTPDKFESSSNYETIRARYGLDLELVMKYLVEENELLCTIPPVYTGEIDYFVQEEMAQNLCDIVFRRSEIGTAECPEREVLERIAQRMATHFDWDQDRITTEVITVENSFNWN